MASCLFLLPPPSNYCFLYLSFNMSYFSIRHITRDTGKLLHRQQEKTHVLQKKGTFVILLVFRISESHASAHKSFYFNFDMHEWLKKKKKLRLLVGRFWCGLCCLVPSQWHWCWVAVLMRTLISPTHTATRTYSQELRLHWHTLTDTHVEQHTRAHICANKPKRGWGFISKYCTCHLPSRAVSNMDGGSSVAAQLWLFSLLGFVQQWEHLIYGQFLICTYICVFQPCVCL